jgi:hypothetical protein
MISEFNKKKIKKQIQLLITNIEQLYNEIFNKKYQDLLLNSNIILINIQIIIKEFTNYFNEIKRILNITNFDIMNQSTPSTYIYTNTIQLYTKIIELLQTNFTMIDTNFSEQEFIKNAYDTYIIWNLYLIYNGLASEIIYIGNLLENSIYKQKYLKYKSKYILLKKLQFLT